MRNLPVEPGIECDRCHKISWRAAANLPRISYIGDRPQLRRPTPYSRAAAKRKPVPPNEFQFSVNLCIADFAPHHFCAAPCLRTQTLLPWSDRAVLPCAVPNWRSMKKSEFRALAFALLLAS